MLAVAEDGQAGARQGRDDEPGDPPLVLHAELVRAVDARHPEDADAQAVEMPEVLDVEVAGQLGASVGGVLAEIDAELLGDSRAWDPSKRTGSLPSTRGTRFTFVAVDLVGRADREPSDVSPERRAASSTRKVPRALVVEVRRGVHGRGRDGRLRGGVHHGVRVAQKPSITPASRTSPRTRSIPGIDPR